MTRRKVERVVAHVIAKMRGAHDGDALPHQSEVKADTGYSNRTVIDGYQLLVAQGYAFKTSDRFFWRGSDAASPVPVRREDAVLHRQMLEVRERFLDTQAACAAAMRVRAGDGVFLDRCKKEVRLIEKDLGTRSLSDHKLGDWRFHDLMYLGCRDLSVIYTARALGNLLRTSMHRHVVMIGSHRDVLEGRAQEHKTVLGFVINGDPDGAAWAAGEHVRHVRQRLGQKACNEAVF